MTVFLHRVSEEGPALFFFMPSSRSHRFELQRESFSLRVEEGKGHLKMHLRGVQEREEQEEEEECFVLEPTFAESSSSLSNY